MEVDKELLKTLFTSIFYSSLEKKSKNLKRVETHNLNDNNCKYKIIYKYFIVNNPNKTMGGEKDLKPENIQNEQEKQKIIEGLKERKLREIKKLRQENKKHNEAIKNHSEEIQKNNELIKRYMKEIKKLEEGEEQRIFDGETVIEKDKKEEK